MIRNTNGPRAAGSRGLVFALLAAAQFMVVLDVSIVNVALPAIQASLGFDASTLPWVVSAYALAFGGFLLLGGRASDLFGRKRVLLLGMASFTVSSLLLGLAPNAVTMIVLRALQGMSAAFMSPAALSLVIVTFSEGAERNRAFGLWTTVATAGAAIGLLLGGFLSQYLSWRWTFFINVPAGLLDLALILRYVPEPDRSTHHRHLDLPGALLVTGGLIALDFAITEGAAWGWLSPGILASFVAAVVLLVGFVWNERRSPHPLVPLSIFRNRNLTGANLMMAPIYAAMMGMFFLLSLYIQAVLHYSPLMTGLAFLPFPFIMGLTSNRVSKFVTRYGFRPFLLTGPVIVAGALAWLSRVPVDGSYWTDVLPSILLIPLGMGMTFMPLVAAATNGVERQNAGLASGLINTSQMMGGALGLALLTGVSESLGRGDVNPLVNLVKGYGAAFLLAVAFLLFALVLAITVVRAGKPTAESAPMAE